MSHPTAPRPWHLVPIALFLVAWHGLLVADYVVIRFALSPVLPGLMDQLPLVTLWAKVGWAMAVWLGLAGALFLLFGDDAAVLLLFAAAVAMVVAMVGVHLAGEPALVHGVPWPIGIALLMLAPALGWVYARLLKRHAVLG